MKDSESGKSERVYRHFNFTLTFLKFRAGHQNGNPHDIFVLLEPVTFGPVLLIQGYFEE